MLIKRVYEIDPMAYPNCGGEMKIVSFIDPPQNGVIEKILTLRPVAGVGSEGTIRP